MTSTSRFIPVFSPIKNLEYTEQAMDRIRKLLLDPKEIGAGLWSQSLKLLESQLIKIFKFDYCVLSNSCTSSIHSYLDIFLSSSSQPKKIICNSYTYPSVTNYLIQASQKKLVELFIYDFDGDTLALVNFFKNTLHINFQNQLQLDNCLFLLTDYVNPESNKELIRSLSVQSIQCPVLIDAALMFNVNRYYDIDYSSLTLALSFSLGKMINVGEGGALLTKNRLLAEQMLEQTYYGVINGRSTDFLKNYSEGKIEMRMLSNSSAGKKGMTAFQSELIQLQIENFEFMIQKKKYLIDLYNDEFGKELIKNDPIVSYRYYFAEPMTIEWINRIQGNLFNLGVGSYLGIKKIQDQAFQSNNVQIKFENHFKANNTKTSDNNMYGFIQLPCHFDLDEKNILLITKKVKKALS